MIKAESGFTFIQLIVVLLIVSVLLFFAYPMIPALFERMESHTTRKHLHEAIRLAKIESYSRGKDIIICAMNSENECSRSAQERFVVFVDNDRDNRLGAKDYIISSESLYLKHGIIKMNASLSRNYMKFMGDTGKPRGNYGNIKYCTLSKNNNNNFQIFINTHGVVTERQGHLYRIEC